MTLHNVTYTRTLVSNTDVADQPPDALVIQLCIPGGTATLEIARPDACVPSESATLRVACGEPGWWNPSTSTWTIPKLDVAASCTHQIYVSDRARMDPNFDGVPNATDLVGDRIAIDGFVVRTQVPDCGLLLPSCGGAVFGFFQVMPDGTVK